MLVVIAIIGILSSVVLSSLSTARVKGRSAALKAEMDSFKKTAQLFYDDNNNSYTGMFSNDPTILALVATTTTDVAIQNILISLEQKSGNFALYGLVSDNAYALYTRLPSATNLDSLDPVDIWCIDSEGKSGNPSSVAVDQFTTPVDVCW